MAANAAWIEDFALFMALKQAHGGKPWNTWEPALRAREAGALALSAAKLADSSKGVTGAEGPSIDTFLSMLYEYGGHLYDNDSNPGKTTVNSDAKVPGAAA